MAEAAMRYRRLGRAGMQVSEISLGSWLTYGGGVEEQTARDCIREAYDLGINFFDTANVYAAGEAERVVGKALREYPRDSYVIATKAYFPMRPGPNGSGLSRKHLREQCDASLQRLGLDYVDLYQCHRWDVNTPVEETILALEELVRAGKILYYGVSEWASWQIAEGMRVATDRGLYGMVSNQPHYNMLDRSIEKEVIPVSERLGIGQVVFSPLAQGVLTGKYAPGQPPPEGSRATDPKQNIFLTPGEGLLGEDTLARVQALKPVAARLDISMAQLALAWILRQPNISSVIVGASRPGQVRDNAAASGLTLSEEDIAEIDGILGT